MKDNRPQNYENRPVEPNGAGEAAICVCSYASPCGELLLGSFGGRLCLCDWTVSRRHQANLRRLTRMLDAEISPGSDAITARAASELDEYFNGRRRLFSMPLLPVGTPFQLRVIEALGGVGYGEQLSYSALAERMGAWQSVRAVANAVGANMLSILVPCHRIVGADGSLHGYAGGVAAKARLLDLESSCPTIFLD